MRPRIDSHIHTQRCGHARGTAVEYVAAAHAAGLEAIVFTEHLPLPATMDPGGYLAIPDAELGTYCREVSSAGEFANGVEVILGAEADWLPGERAWMTRQIERARGAGVRVLLGSVHFLGEWAFDDPNELGTWELRDIGDVWREYAEEWCDAAASGLFDVLAHPDLPKKFGHRPPFDPSGLWADMAQAAARGGAMIEVSSAGLRKPIAELYPGPELLAAFHDAGVDATVGSDAHAPADVGVGLLEAHEAMIAAGYDRVALPLGGGEKRWYRL